MHSYDKNPVIYPICCRIPTINLRAAGGISDQVSTDTKFCEHGDSDRQVLHQQPDTLFTWGKLIYYLFHKRNNIYGRILVQTIFTPISINDD